MFEQLLAIATRLLYASTATNISKKQFKAIAVTVARQFSDDGQMATAY